MKLLPFLANWNKNKRGFSSFFFDDREIKKQN